MVQKTLDYFRIPKKLFWILFAILLIASLIWSLRPKALEVDVGKIDLRLFEELVIDEGISVYKNKRTITAPTDGFVPVHNIKAGDKVSKGKAILNFIWDRDLPLISPMDGVITQVFEKDRRFVPRGTPLFEVGDPTVVEIKASLLSEDVVGLKIGQKAWLDKWGGDKKLEASIQRIEPSAKEIVSALGVKEQRVDVYLEILTSQSHWKQLGDNFRLEVQIIKNKVDQALTVPIGAVFRKGNEIALYTIDEKMKAHIKLIELGPRNRDLAVVKSNVQPGTKVILYPASQIQNGTLVKVRREL